MQRAVDIAQRTGDDEDVVVRLRLDRRPHPIAVATALRRDREVDDALARARRERDLRGQPRRGRCRAAGEARRRPRAHDGSVESPQLDVLTGRGSGEPTDSRTVERRRVLRRRAVIAVAPVAGAVMEQRVLDRKMRRVERRVRPVDEERAERGVRGEVRGDEPDRGERDHAEDQACPQREAPAHLARFGFQHVPRLPTVRIIGGPTAWSLRRR